MAMNEKFRTLKIYLQHLLLLPLSQGQNWASQAHIAQGIQIAENGGQTKKGAMWMVAVYTAHKPVSDSTKLAQKFEDPK